MDRSTAAGRRLAIILPLLFLLFPVALLAFCGTASAQSPVLSYGFQGDGIFPTFATTNSSYWLRVEYDDNDNDTLTDGEPDPIEYFQFEGRTGDMMSVVRLVAFLNDTGDGYRRGIMTSPTSNSLVGTPESFWTTGYRLHPPLPPTTSDLMVASTATPGVDYTGSDIIIRSTATRVASFSGYGPRAEVTTDDGAGYGPLWTTADGDLARTTLVCDPLPAGDWDHGRVRITGPTNDPNVGEIRAITAYDPMTATITVALPFTDMVAQGTEFVLIGPYTTTADGTTRVLYCADLPGGQGQWVGGSVRITGPTGNPLVGQAREIATYDPLSGRIVVRSATPFGQAVLTGVEFELDGFTVVDWSLGAPASGESWLGAQITITEDPHPALNQVRSVVAWSPDTGIFRVDQPFRVRIAVDVAYEIFLAIFTLQDTFSPPLGESGPERCSVQMVGLQVPQWYLNGPTWGPSGVWAGGKIVIDAEDDANRDGDVLDPGDNLPGPGNRSDFYVFMRVVSQDHVRFSFGPWTLQHGLGCKG